MACHVSLTIELWTMKKDYDVGFRFSDYMLSDYLVDSVGIEFLSYETKSNSLRRTVNLCAAYSDCG